MAESVGLAEAFGQRNPILGLAVAALWSALGRG